MTSSADRTNAHYAPLFSRFKADVARDGLGFEAQCLAFELDQIPDVPQGGFVLDAGCGTGRYSAAWRKLMPAARLVGVDINRTILRDGQVDPEALRPVNGTLERLPFADDTFDVVMSRGAIQHTANPRQALRELVRVVKPGGLLFFYTYKHGWFDVALGVARKVAAGIGAPRCSRAVYAGVRAMRLDPRVASFILDELYVPIRFAFTEKTIDEWLQTSGKPLASIQPLVHAQFGNFALPVDRRTAFLHRVLPRNGLIARAVRPRAA